MAGRPRAKRVLGLDAVSAVPGLPNEMSHVLSESVTTDKGTPFSQTVKKILAKTLEKSRQKLHYMEMDNDISKMATKLNLAEYTFEDEKPLVLDPLGKHQSLALDVTALDRYNEDIRYFRSVIMDECRRLPEDSEPSGLQEQKLAHAIANLCRASYYGTQKAQLLAAATVPILVWLLNKPNVSPRLHLIIIRCLGELLYSSTELKYQFAECAGVKILYKYLQHIPSQPMHSQMAAYVLAMACVGSAEIIEEVRKQKDIEELVGEITFEYYWLDWPVNYGVILQGLLFGPHAISPNQELFRFL